MRGYLIPVILTIIILLPRLIFGQVQIEGRVFDSNNNKPLVGATITDPSGSSGTITTTNGYFSWRTDQEIHEIVVSYLGYIPKTVRINNDNRFFNIGLTISETQLQEVVISAYRNGQRYQDIPGPVSLITLKDINRGEGITIVPSLNRIPSVYMHSGALNTNRITIRGIGSRSPFSTTKIRAYLNDIPLTTGTGETTIEDIDLGIIDRVEVIKGPSSSIYGAGLGGTINYSVKKAEYRNTSLALSSKIGSFGLMNHSGIFRHNSDFGSISLSVHDLYSDGYRENNSYDRRSYNTAGQIFTGKKGVLSFIGNFIDLKAFIPSSIDSITYVQNPEAAAFTWKQVEGFEDYTKNLLGLNYTYDFTQKWLFSGSVFTSNRDSYELRPFNTLTEDTRAYGLRAYTAFDNEGNDNLISEFNIGMEIFSEHYDWSTLENGTEIILSDNAEERNYVNFFTQIELSISTRTNLVLGMNLNHTSYELTDLYDNDSIDFSGNYSFESQWSPRIAIAHRIDPNHSLFATVSHGFSPPTLEETLTPEGQVNPDIKPESGYNFEIGSRGTFRGNRLFYDFSIYTMRIENLLVARRVINDIFIGVNAGKTTHSGFDLTMGYDLLPGLHRFLSSANLFITYMFADYRFKEFEDNGDDYSGNELTGTPSNKINAGLDISANLGLYGSLEFLYVDEMPMNDANTAFSESYSLLNSKLGFRKILGGKQRLELDIYAGINNLLDEKYASMISVNAPSFGGNPPRYYYPGLPRNYYGGINLAYRFSND